MIRIKRAYDRPEAAGGARFLVGRLWPRALKREGLKLTGWLKEVAPSGDLRRWFGHDPDKWEGFRGRYFAELDAWPEAWRPLLEAAQKGAVTFFFAAKDPPAQQRRGAQGLPRIQAEGEGKEEVSRPG